MPAPSNLLPDFPAIQSVRFVQAADKSTSLSGRIFARERGPLRFEVTLAAHPMTGSQFAPISAFLAAQTGPANPFYIEIQQPLSGPLLQVGNFINLSSNPHGKLYQVTATDPTVVHPPAPAGTPMTHENRAFMRCAMKGSTQQFQDNQTGLVSFTLTVEEHLT